jgi:hypothetical protein
VLLKHGRHTRVASCRTAAPGRISCAPLPLCSAPLALNLLARGLLPCTRTRLRNRVEPATGPAPRIEPAPRCSCPDLRMGEGSSPCLAAPWLLRARRAQPPPSLRSFSFRAHCAITAPSTSPRAGVYLQQGRALRGRPCRWNERDTRTTPPPPSVFPYLPCAWTAAPPPPCATRTRRPSCTPQPRPAMPLACEGGGPRCCRRSLGERRPLDVAAVCPGEERPRRRRPELRSSVARPLRRSSAPGHLGSFTRGALLPPCGTTPSRRQPLGGPRPRGPPACRPPTSAPPPRAAPMEGGRGKKIPGQRCRRWGKRKDARERENREEGEIGLPKDLCANLENCRDLLVK